ncbi:DNA-binding protein HEXBP [Linum grandiflorum]
MSAICGCLAIVIPQWKQKNAPLFILLPSKRNINIIRSVPCCSSNNDPISKLGYDSSDELLGLAADADPKLRSVGGKPKSWFGPNGQYIKELPCPSCRGRGYTPCSECGIERSRLDCSQCSGKGIMTCGRCSGECVVWEESIDEQPWEKARSISAFKVKEDDEVDNLDIKLETKKKSKRVYRSTSPEVGLKISRSLKNLNAKTGLFSNRMKIIHSDPKLSAQRAAAIKKAKGSAAARMHASETLKAFFKDPENRRKRSIAMRGVRFYCTNCGREGHRKHYCPELKNDSEHRQFRCRICGGKGHNRRTCPESKTAICKVEVRRVQHCRICGQTGHNQRSCPRATGLTSGKKRKQITRRKYRCSICNHSGHNSRSCPQVAIPESG